MFDAVILAKEVKVEDGKTLIKLPNGLEVVLNFEVKIPEECKGPVMISVVKDKINVTKVAGPCTVWSTIHLESSEE